MAMRVFNVGDVLAASDVNEYLVNTRFAVKPPSPGGDTSRATNTTLTNDPDLSVAVDANKTYWCDIFLLYLSTSTANLKIAFTVPGSAVFTGGIHAYPAGGSNVGLTPIDSGGPITGTQHIAGFAAFDGCARISGILATAASAGNFTLQWAQDTSAGTTTIMRGGSSMFLRRVA